MTANNDTGQPDKKGSTESKLLGASTTRRRLIGGAAALATIPAVTTADSDDVDESDETNDDLGARRTPTGEHSGLWASIDMGEVIDEQTDLGVVGYYSDDEGGSVQLSISTKPAGMHVDMSPGRAREFANDLLEAADAAEGVE